MSEPIKVNGPDGRVINFPAGMSHADINVEMGKLYNSQSGPQETAAPEALNQEAAKSASSGFGGAAINMLTSLIPFGGDKANENLQGRLSEDAKGRVGSAVLGAGQGLSFGFLDEAVGVADPELKEGLRAGNDLAKEAHPKSHLAGEVVGGGLTGGAGLAKAGAIKGGVIGGGAFGVGEADGGLTERVTGGAQGAALGGIFGKIGDAGVKFVGKLLAKPINYVNGQLTDAGRLAMRKAGIQPDDLTPDDVKAIAAQVELGADPAAAKRTLDAENLPVPVKLTKGQTTGDAEDLIRESAAQDGLLGDKAKATVTDFTQNQNVQLQDNVKALRTQIGGDAVDVSEGGQAAASKIRELGQAEKAAAVSLRREAEKGVANVPQKVAKDLGSTLRESLAKGGYFPEDATLTGVHTKLDILDNLSKGETVDITRLMRWRQSVGTAAKAGGPDGKHLGDMGRTFDAAMDEAFENALVNGDEAAVKQWAKSRSQFRQYFSKFEGKKGAKKIVAQMAAGELDASAASNMIFGASRVFGTKNSSKTTKEIKNLLGADSKEWNGLRQEALTRLVDTDETGNIGLKFARNLEKSLKKDPETFKEFFTDEEILGMRRIASVAKTLNQSPRSRSNPSNSTALKVFMNKWGGTYTQTLFQKLPGLRGVVDAFSEASNAQKAVRAVNYKAKPRLAAPDRSVSGGVGASGVIAAQGANQ